MINYYDLYMNGFREYDLINGYEYKVSFATVQTLLSFTVVQKEGGFMHQYKIVELTGDYSRTTFDILINNKSIFDERGFSAGVLPLMDGQFIDVMRPLEKGDVLTVTANVAIPPARLFISWIKFVSKNIWRRTGDPGETATGPGKRPVFLPEEKKL